MDIRPKNASPILNKNMNPIINRLMVNHFFEETNYGLTIVLTNQAENLFNFKRS